MDSDVKFVLGLLLATVIITAFLTASTVIGLAHREAVKHGCAQYSQKTGEFEWITRTANEDLRSFREETNRE